MANASSRKVIQEIISSKEEKSMDSHPRLTIRALRARGLNPKLSRPIETASGVMNSAPLVLIDVLTQEGIMGSSYIRCYTPLALQSLVHLVANCEELLRDQTAAPATVERKLQQHFRLLGTQGLLGMVLAGIDMALWDARARACGLPLVTLLGGEPKPIPAYGSLKMMSPEKAAAEAEELLPLGFTAFKVKIGRSDLAADLATIRAVRRAIGDERKLMVDYNQSLSVAEAIARVYVLDEEDLYWIEEPTRADDFEGHARIASAASTAIQLGENWWGPHDMAKSIVAHASDHVMLDVMKVGGVSGWLRAASLAEAAGLPVSSHIFPEFSVHLLGVTPTGLWLEHLDIGSTILTEPVRIKDGCAIIPDRPGSGLEWNEEAVKRWLVQ